MTVYYQVYREDTSKSLEDKIKFLANKYKNTVGHYPNIALVGSKKYPGTLIKIKLDDGHEVYVESKSHVLSYDVWMTSVDINQTLIQFAGNSGNIELPASQETKN